MRDIEWVDPHRLPVISKPCVGNVERRGVTIHQDVVGRARASRIYFFSPVEAPHREGPADTTVGGP